MYDLAKSYERKIQKLKNWRDRYSKVEYPYKVIMNMFYDLFATQYIWPEIDRSFSGLKKHADYTDAVNEIAELRNNTKIYLF